MAEDTNMLAFFINLFKKADDPGGFTKRMLRQKYLDHVGLNALNSTQEVLFENAITQAFQKYEEESDQTADSDSDFEKKSSKSNKRKLKSKSQGLKKSKTNSSDDDNSSDDFKSNKIKLINKNKKSTNKSGNMEKLKLDNQKVNDDSSSEDDQPLIKKSNSLPENNDVEPENESSSDSENEKPKLANESDDDDFANKDKKMIKVKKVPIKNASDKRPGEKQSTNKTSSKKGSSEDKEDSDVEKLKGYVRMAGIRITNYQKVFEGCSNKKSKLGKLHEVLKEAGLKGRPSIKACQKLKKKRETAKEVAELDLGNILENKSGRTRRSTGSHKKEVERNITSMECKGEFKENVFADLEDLVDSD